MALAALLTTSAGGDWIPGDLHLHSEHSDGDSPVAAIIADAEDEAIRAVVLTGNPHFAAGADISEFRGSMESGTGPVLAERLSAAATRPTVEPGGTVASMNRAASGRVSFRRR